MTTKPKPVKYDPCFVTFLDLLGFGHLVDSGTSPEQIAKILDRVEAETQIDPEDSELLGERQLFISDSVVRIAELRPDEPEIGDELGFILVGLIHIQAALIDQGIVVRGAVTFGPTYLREGRVFGPAYQRAYRLEHSEEFPRIVIDPMLIEELKKPRRGKSAQQPPFYEDIKPLLMVEDGIYSLDYFRVLVDECEHPGGYFKLAERHRVFIEGRLKEFAGNANVLRKYVWLAEYHNRTLRGFRRQVCIDEYELDPHDFLISTVPAMPPRTKSG